MMNHYKFQSFLKLLEVVGKKKYGNLFRIYESDVDVIFQLYVYFMCETESAKKLHISLRKGILLNGPVGCGKTSLFMLFREFTDKEFRYSIHSCREISFEFNESGFSVILKYGKHSIDNHTLKPRIILFDDLGTERTLKFYGTECNVMGEIILSRYDQFVSNNMITYITTNINSNEIEEIYGKRVRSRMREMFNLISFSETTPDKRM